MTHPLWLAIRHYQSDQINDLVSTSSILAVYDGMVCAYQEGSKEVLDQILQHPRLYKTISHDLHDTQILQSIKKLSQSIGPDFIHRFIDQAIRHEPRKEQLSLFFLISECMGLEHHRQEVVKEIITHPGLVHTPHISRVCPRLISLWEKTPLPMVNFYKDICWGHLKKTLHPLELIHLLSSQAYIHVSLQKEAKLESQNRVQRWVEELALDKSLEWFEDLEKMWIVQYDRAGVVEQVFPDQKAHLDALHTKMHLQSHASPSLLASSPRKM